MTWKGANLYFSGWQALGNDAHASTNFVFDPASCSPTGTAAGANLSALATVDFYGATIGSTWIPGAVQGTNLIFLPPPTGSGSRFFFRK